METGSLSQADEERQFEVGGWRQAVEYRQLKTGRWRQAVLRQADWDGS